MNTKKQYSDRIKLPFTFDGEKMLSEVNALKKEHYEYYKVIPLRSPAHLVDTSLPNNLSRLPSTESKTPLLYLHGLSACFLEICLTSALFFFVALTSEGPSGSLPNNLSIPRSSESKGPEKA